MEGTLNTLLPRLVNEGVFGDVEFVDMEFINDDDIGAHFASKLSFITLNLKGKTKESLHILVKTPISHRRDSISLFQTELLMYNEVLPILGFSQTCYPKFYYGLVDYEHPENSVLIFENLKYRQYVNSETPIFLDYDHILLVLKSIAKFHSLSFVLKYENAEKFNELAEKMKQNAKERPKSPRCRRNVPAQIAIAGFEEEHGSEQLLDRFSNALENSDQIIENLSKPQEPFAVVCHGDFCNNNIMYKYENNRSLIDCAFVDFQLSKYSSLVTDISFFLYLNNDGEIKEKYWDQLLVFYWKSLRESVPNHISVPSFDSFLEHFSKTAVYGFNISCLFLPILMDSLCLKESTALADAEEDKKKRISKCDEIGLKVRDMFCHLYHKEYVDPFLDYMNGIEGS